MIVAILRVLILLPLLFAGYRVWGPWRAALLASSPTTMDRVARALQWDPQNSLIHYQMALYLRDSLEFRDLRASSKSLARAIELNPYGWQYRFEAGRLWELLNEPKRAESAYRASVELSPVGSHSHWRLANFYLRMGRLEDALPELETAMLKDPSLQETAFTLMRSSDARAESVLRVWPTDHTSQLRLLGNLCRDAAVPTIDDAEGLLAIVWQSVLKGPDEVPLAAGAKCIDYLRRHVSNDRARSAWIELMRSYGHVDDAFESGLSAVWNGSFELPISNTGLGWRTGTRKGIRSYSDRENCFAGLSCLRLEFDGTENLAAVGIEQTVSVQPSRAYRLSFSSRSQGLSTDRGLFLEVTDRAAGDHLVSTEPISGTSPWRYHEATFETGAGASELSIQVQRNRSLRLDNRLSGIFWLDDVSLEEMAD